MTEQVATTKLGLKTKIGYGAGHILNDIVAPLTFSYTLLFFQNVIKIDKANVGIIFLIGQLADGFTSPLVGYLSDLELKCLLCNSYGRRKVCQNINRFKIYIFSLLRSRKALDLIITYLW